MNVDPNNAACVDDLGIFTEVSEKTTCGSYKKCLFLFLFFLPSWQEESMWSTKKCMFGHSCIVSHVHWYTSCIWQCTEKIFTAPILEPTCQLLSPKPRTRVSKWDPDTLVEDSVDLLRSITHLPEPRAWCRVNNLPLLTHIQCHDQSWSEALCTYICLTRLYATPY